MINNLFILEDTEKLIPNGNNIQSVNSFRAFLKVPVISDTTQGDIYKIYIQVFNGMILSKKNETWNFPIQ